MKKEIFALFFLSAFLFSCSSETSEKTNANYKETKNSLLKKEEAAPASFIVVKGASKKNIIGQTIVRGTLTNKASIATYKDVDLKLSFYSRTQALLETDKETIYLILDPGDARDFKTKYFAPKGTDSVALQVLGAKIVSQ